MEGFDHQIISRAEAKAQGLKFYFTGKPCKHGSVLPRGVSSRKCTCSACKDKANLASLRWRSQNPQKAKDGKVRYRKNNADKERSRRLLYDAKNAGKISEDKRQWRLANPAAVSAQKRRYREKHGEKALAGVRAWRENNADYNRQYFQKNREAEKERGRCYRKANPEKIYALLSKRRAAELQAVPLWFSEFDQFAFEEAYALSEQRQAETGIQWHVDHMIPLQAKKACGLHCAENIQVIPAVMNLSKNNKMILATPQDWLRA